jgi:Na+/proline symporter
MFYQRAFSIKKEKLKKSFFLGAAIFAIVPISMGILGFIATGLDMKVPAGLVNYEVIKELLPVWAVYPFLFAVMCGLLSTCDSAMCAASSLAAKDWFLGQYQKVVVGKPLLRVRQEVFLTWMFFYPLVLLLVLVFLQGRSVIRCSIKGHLVLKRKK